MKILITSVLMIISGNTATIFDFSNKISLKNWVVVDDVVMGGRSAGSLSINEDGHGEFKGYVSLENNGGFSSIRYRFQSKSTKEFSRLAIRLKGDGKAYQLRVKPNTRNYYSYVSSFSTNGEWQTIEIPLEDMYPTFRGRRLNQPNYKHDAIQEIAFLIANNSNEQFSLLIDKIELK
jgi:NADH dehydrogenase [ubiquinone] 1 alpha subcomplex assembly factor 1